MQSAARVLRFVGQRRFAVGVSAPGQQTQVFGLEVNLRLGQHLQLEEGSRVCGAPARICADGVRGDGFVWASAGCC